MSRRPALFVGVAFCARTLDVACVGLTVIGGRHYLTPIRLDALPDARPTLIKVERWNGTALAVDLQALGLPVIVSKTPRLSRDSIRGLGVADPSVDPLIAAAWMEVAQYVWGEVQARHLSAWADAILLALSAHALQASNAGGFEYRAPHPMSAHPNDRFIGFKLAVSRRFQILLGVADCGVKAAEAR